MIFLPRVFLLGKKLTVEIPPDIVEYQGISEGQELQFSSKDVGSIVVSVKKNNVVSKDSVLKELLKLPFEKRVVKSVLESFSPEKRKIFAELVKEDKVIISDKTYRVSSGSIGSVKVGGVQNPLMDSFDYLIINEEAEARRISGKLNEDILSGKVIGVRGFDSNFYIVKLKVFEKVSLKITEIMDAGIADFKGLSDKIGDKDLCKTVIEVMKDKGLIIEKRNGFFVLV